MRIRRIVTSLVFVLPAFAGVAAAQSTHDVAFEVQAIDNMAFTGSPSLTVSAAVAGGAPTSASDALSTYAITTNQTNRKITAQINLAMPSGVTLSANLAAPSGATSAGAVALTTIAQDVVTDISNVSQSGVGVTYTLDATINAVPVASTRTVTYTIIAGA